jgi:sugar/nucleoside kinase (ribokinase family)
MPDRAAVASAAASGLRRFAAAIGQTPVMVGFDGFVDSIIHVVDTRQGLDDYTTMPTIERFGQKILAASGQSSNFELVIKLTKLGGNGPIMANALASHGFAVTYIGALGYPSLHPAFEELSTRSTVLSFSDPGFTDCLEFNDGKLMLGKHATLRDINIQRLLEIVGADQFHAVIAQSQLLAMVNWTMLTETNSIWRHLIDKVLPKVAPASGTGRKLVFVDLADPEKRPREDLLGAVKLCGEFMPFANVTLGMNLKESSQVADVLGIKVSGDPETQIEQTAKAIREKLGLTTVVIHPRRGAAAATLNQGKVESASFAGPFIREPKLSTGAGDNFNAGFVLGQLAGLSVAECLCTGTANSGYYVRNAGSATLAQLADFCDNLPDPQ